MNAFSRRSIKGFTLVEFVITIMVISVLAVFITSNWPGRALNLGAQTEQLATDLRYTQSLSMTQGQRYCLIISGNSYQIVNSATGAAVALALGGSTETLDSNISFGAISPATMFVFDGMGVPYSSASGACNTANAQAATALASTATITLIAGGQSRTISISPETGRVLVQ